MTEPHFSAGSALVVAATGVGLTALAEKASLAYFGIPLSAATAAMTGALVPLMLLDPEPLPRAFRLWLGSVALALISTAAVLWAFGWPDKVAIGVAGGIGAFGRVIFAAVRGELPALITALRERLTGKPKEGQ